MGERTIVMTSEFVRQVHRATCQRLAAAGTPEQQIREHLQKVWFAEAEVELLLSELKQAPTANTAATAPVTPR